MGMVVYLPAVAPPDAKAGADDKASQAPEVVAIVVAAVWRKARLWTLGVCCFKERAFAAVPMNEARQRKRNFMVDDNYIIPFLAPVSLMDLCENDETAIMRNFV
jgi:hypothetical protein